MATTVKVKVIRIPRTDGPEDEPAFVLVHVSPRRSNPLDCKLIGTENTQVYLVSLKHTKTAELLQSKKLYTPEQWNQLLCFVLYGTPADDTALVEDLEVSATADESTLKITIRKNVAGFKQKVGVIKLVQSDEEAANYDGFEWCGIALEETSHSTHELETLKSKVKEQEEAIEKLDASFKELIKAKADHEDELLQKFAALLNEKKLKIRDQQRLLASANVDPRKLAAVEATRQARSSDAGKSRAGKRKVAQRVEVAEEDSDDGFEKMDMDQDEVHNDSDADRGATPERDDDTTADEAEDTEDEEPILVAKPPKRAGEASGRDASPSKATANDELPPPRSLPFGKKAPTPKPPVVEGSDTESEGDDEL